MDFSATGEDEKLGVSLKMFEVARACEGGASRFVGVGFKVGDREGWMFVNTIKEGG